MNGNALQGKRSERMAKTINATYIGRKQVADILGVSVQTVSNYVEKGYFKTKRIGNMVYIDKETMFDNLPKVEEVATLDNAIAESREELTRKLHEYHAQIQSVQRAIMGDKGGYYLTAMKDLMSVISGMGIKVDDDYMDLMIQFFSSQKTYNPRRLQRLSRQLMTVRLAKTLRKASKRISELQETERRCEELKRKTILQREHIHTLELNQKKLAKRLCEYELREKVKLAKRGDKVKIENARAEYAISGYDIEKVQLLKTRVREMNFSVRVLNCLNYADANTIEDVVRHNKTDFLKLRNFGKKALGELDDKIEMLGLHFGMTDEEIESFKRL